MTIIKVATPREIPKNEKSVISEKNFSFVFGNRYFKETQNSKYEIIFDPGIAKEIQINFQHLLVSQFFLF